MCKKATTTTNKQNKKPNQKQKQADKNNKQKNQQTQQKNPNRNRRGELVTNNAGRTEVLNLFCHLCLYQNCWALDLRNRISG